MNGNETTNKNNKSDPPGDYCDNDDDDGNDTTSTRCATTTRSGEEVILLEQGGERQKGSQILSIVGGTSSGGFDDIYVKEESHRRQGGCCRRRRENNTTTTIQKENIVVVEGTHSKQNHHHQKKKDTSMRGIITTGDEDGCDRPVRNQHKQLSSKEKDSIHHTHYSSRPVKPTNKHDDDDDTEEAVFMEEEEREEDSSQQKQPSVSTNNYSCNNNIAGSTLLTTTTTRNEQVPTAAPFLTLELCKRQQQQPCLSQPGAFYVGGSRLHPVQTTTNNTSACCTTTTTARTSAADVAGDYEEEHQVPTSQTGPAGGESDLFVAEVSARLVVEENENRNHYQDTAHFLRRLGEQLETHGEQLRNLNTRIADPIIDNATSCAVVRVDGEDVVEDNMIAPPVTELPAEREGRGEGLGETLRLMSKRNRKYLICGGGTTGIAGVALLLFAIFQRLLSSSPSSSHTSESPSLMPSGAFSEPPTHIPTFIQTSEQPSILPSLRPSQRPSTEYCYNGRHSGTCIHISNCTSETNVVGLCPSHPWDVQCCLTYGTCQDDQGTTGTCINETACTGVRKSGYCPGPNNIQCCLEG